MRALVDVLSLNCRYAFTTFLSSLELSTIGLLFQTCSVCVFSTIFGFNYLSCTKTSHILKAQTTPISNPCSIFHVLFIVVGFEKQGPYLEGDKCCNLQFGARFSVPIASVVFSK